MDPARQLLHRYLDEIASPAELVELAGLLPQRPDLADELAWAAHSETLMESHFSERRALTAVAAVLALAPAPAPVRRSVPWKWCAAAVLLVTAGVLFGFWIGRSQPGAGAVVSGRVRIDGVESVRIPDDSWIEVVGENAAVIRLPDGSRAELAPASSAVLRQKTRWSRKVVELDRGRAAFHVEKGRNRFRVDTPLGSVSTQDAEFCVELQSEDEEGEQPLNKQSTLVLVVAALVGQVEVDSGGQRYVLAAGQKQTFADKSASGKKKPVFSGTIVEASAASLTVESPPSKKGGEAVRKQYKLTEKTVFDYFGVAKEGEKPTVGYLASVWLAEGSNDTLARVQLGLKPVIFDGKVIAVAADAKSFTLERPSKGGPITTELKIAERAKVVYKDADKGDKPTVGYFARVWMKPGTQDAASGVVFSSKSIAEAFGKKKTGPNAGKKPFLAGTVKALAADGKSFTLAFPKSKTGDEPKPIDVQITENTKVLSGKVEGKLAVGQPVSVLLQEGAARVAETVLIGKPSGPSVKKPGSKGEQSITLDGAVTAVAADAKSFTLERPSKGGPIQTEIKIAEGAKVAYKDVDKGDKPTVGYFARVFLAGKNRDAAVKIVFSSKKFADAPTEKKKPGKKAGLAGTVKALAADGKSFTLLPPRSKKGGEPTPINIRIGERTKITTGKEAAKLAVGQTVTVWLEEGSTNSAATVQVGPAVQPEKPKPVKGKKPSPEEIEKKPEGAKKPREPAKPARDPAPTAALIDAEIDRRLAADKIPASPQAGDAEFLRRVTLDLTGRIPTYRETVAFLDSKDSAKRRKLVDELLDRPGYGEHFATIWRNLIVPRNTGGKAPADIFTPWLVEQFNDNRGWNAIVADLLNAEGPINNNPASAFVMANSENNQPKPSMVAGATARFFWGVNLRCAECHNHPFANWKQDDFWGTAAFFGKVQFSGYKGGPATLREILPINAPAGNGKKIPKPATAMRGSAILVPDGAGKAAGRLVKARFLGGVEPALDDKAPFRPSFTAWATGVDNPYFARAAVNRAWAHFFGRGFVHPLDGFNESNPPSHPELLNRLASEFAASGFDLKHLARCITTSKAYQRTSRPLPGNEKDAIALSHVTLKVLTPEVVYESLAVVMTPDKNAKSTSTGKKGGKKFTGKLGVSRALFVAAFRTGEESDPLEYTQGIPQHLRLMNAAMLNHGAPVVDVLSQSQVSQTEAIDVLYLTALSRRPTPAETRLMSGYLSRRKDAREGYSGVLWILLNSSEFALNR